MYKEDILKAAKYYNHRWDPKFMENMMYPVKSSLTAMMSV